MTYIGDCKMAARSTRAFVATSGDYYLCPLGQVQVSAEELTELLTAFAGHAGIWRKFLAHKPMQAHHKKWRKAMHTKWRWQAKALGKSRFGVKGDLWCAR
ncbi:MAG: hypothetical protein WKF84_14845 [Pyrinomonadaceae bacterium]